MTDTIKLVKSLVKEYGNTRESLLPVLQGVVAQQRYLSDEVMTEVAKQLDIATADVYGTATFYSFLETHPLGENVIRICKTITCDMHGKNQIVKAIEDMLKIKIGETTQNKKFTLLETNCLGWCHKGPAMLINDEPYTELTPDKAKEIIGKLLQHK